MYSNIHIIYLLGIALYHGSKKDISNASPLGHLALTACGGRASFDTL